MSKNKIAVFGASGRIGSILLDQLSNNKVKTVAVTRDLSNARSLPFVEWFKADMGDIEALYAALTDSDSIFLLSGFSAKLELEQKNVIQVAKELGIEHIVKLSSGAAEINSKYYIPKAHGAIENFLIGSGINYTILRPNGIMQNWLNEIARSVRQERKFYESTGAGKRAYVDSRDVAEVGLKCLMNPIDHFNKTYLLTGDKAINYYDVADAISNVIGERIEYIPISLETASEEMKQAGVPPALIETFLAYDKIQLDGNAEDISPSVREILGKPARNLEDFVKDYAAYFK